MLEMMVKLNNIWIVNGDVRASLIGEMFVILL